MTPGPTTHLACLRAGTRDAHDRIETVPALHRLLEADLTQGEYVAVLRHLHAFHASIEPAIAAELEAFPQAAAMLDGSRPRALARDLDWFGVSTMPPPMPPPLKGIAAALGALYVIEGSGLGGRVIARHVTASVGVADGAGGSFYCRLDADTAKRRWQALANLLDRSDADPGQMVRGACLVFQAMESWLRTIEIVAGMTRSVEMREAVTP